MTTLALLLRRAITPTIVLAALAVTGSAAAQGPRFTLQPIAVPTEPTAIPLYSAASVAGDAVQERWGNLIGDLPNGSQMKARIAWNVTVPTMTPVLPNPGKATGAAVLVAPGGAFMSLSMDTEGFQVARWLADRGIAAFVLKYRLNPSPNSAGDFMAAMGQRMAAATHVEQVPEIKEPRATQDALRALALIRSGAAKWHVDPARVGMIGFSAGAMTTLQSVLAGEGAARPAFLGYIYGPITPVVVPAGAPPMFAAIALDDGLFGRQGFGIIDAWRKADVPVELHAYQRGDHGFGIGRPGTTSSLVMDEFRLWLQTNGFLQKR